jgi:hypothetical protein
MLKVASVSTKYLSLVNSSVKKIKPAFAGKCKAVAVACVGKAAEPKEIWRRISFLTRTVDKNNRCNHSTKKKTGRGHKTSGQL